MERNKRQVIMDLLAVVVGNFLYALTVKLFLEPTGLITGGTMGLALTANHFWGTDINLFVLLFNSAMLILGLVGLGKAFAATTVASTFLSPLFMELIDRTIGQP
ncbi:MAG: YitT family protein, partial [Oscillospiraceae bacterium]|nr:YitT family protein [Oscillospiraceae bacterium]